MISTNNYICFLIIKTQKLGDCNLGPTDEPIFLGELFKDDCFEKTCVEELKSKVPF